MQQKKKLLIIAYNFYEDTMAAVRMRRIAARIGDYGYSPIILTHPPLSESQAVRAADYEMLHAEAVDLGAVWRRLRGIGRDREDGPGGGPARLQSGNIRITSIINRWLMIPDKQVVWLMPALGKVREYLESSSIDLIYASLEPRTSLLVASRLAGQTRIPCIMEYRDLWTGSPYYSLAQPTALHRWIHRRLERNVLARADGVTVLSSGIRQYLESQYGKFLKAAVEVNYNFFDPNECPAPAKRKNPDQPFIIVYAGAMYFSRSPQVFLRGLRLFIDAQQLPPGAVKFRWIGSVFGMDDPNPLIAELRLRDYIEFMGQVSHEMAMQMLLESSCALILQAPNDNIHIPGKLFEAMGARVPVLALSNPCEVVDIIDETRAGIACRHDPAEIAEALKTIWMQLKDGGSWPYNNEDTRRFRADQAVQKLAAMFDRISFGV